jgi:hypothetical protein
MPVQSRFADAAAASVRFPPPSLPHCMQTLTTDGFKTFEEMQVLARDGKLFVAVYDAQKKQIVYEPATVRAVRASDAATDLYEICSKSEGRFRRTLVVPGDYRVTRVYSRWMAGSDGPGSCVTTISEMTGGSRTNNGAELVLDVANGLQTPVPLEELVPLADLIPGYKRAGKATRKIMEKAFIQLFGFWLGDGTLAPYHYARSTHAPEVQFQQNKESDIDWLKDKLQQVGFEEDTDYKVHTCHDDEGEGIHISSSKHPRLVEWFYREFAGKYTNGLAAAAANFGAKVAADAEARCDAAARARAEYVGCKGQTMDKIKWMPKWVFKLSKEQCEWLLEGLIEADGESSAGENVANKEALPGGDHGSRRIWTSCPRFRDDVVHIALHAGRSSIYSLAKAKGTKSTIKTGKQRGKRIVSRRHSWVVHMAFPDSGHGRLSPLVSARRFKLARARRQQLYRVTTPSARALVVRRASDNWKKSNRAVVLWQPAAAASAGKVRKAS